MADHKNSELMLRLQRYLDQPVPVPLPPVDRGESASSTHLPSAESRRIVLKAFGLPVIVTFHKTSSSEDRTKLLDDLKSKGAQVVKDESVNSPIMPFVVVSMPEDHFESLQSDSLQGHSVVKHVEKDGEMRIQA